MSRIPIVTPARSANHLGRRSVQVSLTTVTSPSGRKSHVPAQEIETYDERGPTPHPRRPRGTTGRSVKSTAGCRRRDAPVRSARSLFGVNEELDLHLLQLIADLADLGKSGTQAIARAKFDADIAAKRPAHRTERSPYFWLDRQLGALRDAGFIDIDPGMAQAVPAGEPTPGPGEYYIDLTDAGRKALCQP